MSNNVTFDQALKSYINENIGKAHDYITNQLILESLIKNGKVTIEEAQFFNKAVFEVLYESSHIMVPSKEEVLAVLEENFNAQMAAANAGQAPDAGVPAPDVPMNIDMPPADGVPGLEAEAEAGPEIIDVNGVPYIKQPDGTLVPADMSNGADEVTPVNQEPTITPNDQDVTDTPVAPEGAIAAGNPSQPQRPMNESTEVSNKNVTELTENELLINKLIETIKG